jgi:hypothetical protein
MNVSIRNCLFSFRCEKKWGDLEMLSDAKVRFCHDCRRTVHFCHTDEELREAVIRNDCVALEIPSPESDDEKFIMGLFEPPKY